MSVARRTRRYELEAAERRVIEQLNVRLAVPSSARRVSIVAAAVALFGLAFAARLAVNDPGALLANFYVVPIALLAIEFGTKVGLFAALVALGLVLLWGVVERIDVSALGYTSRIAVFVMTGAVVGRFSERLRADISVRQRAQQRLALYADELERANNQLARTVERLEAFAEIARAVGGETDLDRVLSLILAHGKEIIAVSDLIVYLAEGSELVAVALGDERRVRLPIHDSVAGEVLLSGRPARMSAGDHGSGLEQMAPGATVALLVPLAFRGERLGILVGIIDETHPALTKDDEQLMGSVAASAATAIATARSVAAARLRLSVEAAEEARARWARELHDESLQGLSGARMVLSAGLAGGDPADLRKAAETADEHLGEEMRKLRDLIAELRPAALDDLGLAPAIESLAKRQAALGGFSVRAELNVNANSRLARDTEIVTYRIVQEALSNVVKHSGATTVTVKVTQLEDRVELSVTDDGRGFDPDQAFEGFGLMAMRERAMLVGGTLSVRSGSAHMTCVSAVLPARAEPGRTSS